jgi:hypothetical protein
MPIRRRRNDQEYLNGFHDMSFARREEMVCVGRKMKIRFKRQGRKDEREDLCLTMPFLFLRVCCSSIIVKSNLKQHISNLIKKLICLMRKTERVTFQWVNNEFECFDGQLLKQKP